MKFEERSVAFIDVLGFKALVNDSVNNQAAFSQLEALVQLLSSAVPNLDAGVDSSVPTRLIPKHQYISDCIILSAPIKDNEISFYNGLEIVIMRIIQLTHFFLNFGYLIRGGVSVGKVWHSDSNIVGPAYQEAYLLEQNGDTPFVLLSKSACEKWRGGSRMCLQYNGKIFVNGLHDFYIPNNTEYGVIGSTYKKYSDTVNKAIQSDMPEGAKNKWMWFKSFLDMESTEGLKWAQA